MKNQILSATDAQRMTSLEIADITGKPHNDVLKAIRKMEEAWTKVQGGNFSLSSRTYELPNGGSKTVPCYELTKTECLYIATKFNDEARARLVLRWQQLEQERMKQERMKQQGVRGLLVTEDDIMREAEVIIGRTLLAFNRHADGCITASDIATAIGIEVGDLNSWLTDMGVQAWRRGQFRLTPEYEGRGLAQDRLFIYYSKNGKQKERTYLVWTKKGAEMINEMINKD